MDPTRRRLQPQPQVLSRSLGEEVVLLDLASGTYFGLNPVGARLWQLALQGEDLESALTLLESEFDVEPQALREDVERLLGELVAAGVAKVTG